MREVVSNIKNFFLGLKQKKIKVIYLLLIQSVAVIIVAGIFINLYFSGSAPGLKAFPIFRSATPTYEFSILGEGEDMLLKPMAVAVNKNAVYVTDTLNGRVQVFSPNGDLLFSFGSKGNAPGQFSFPYGIDIDSNGDIYVADTYNGGISIFNKEGNFQRYFALKTKDLTQPSGIMIKDNLLYVANLDPGYILVFDMTSEELINVIGSEGEGASHLLFPNDLTLGPDGNLYVSDTGNNRIQVFALSGEYVKTLDINPDLIFSPRGLAFNSYGQLYIVSKLNNEVVIIDKEGKVVDTFGKRTFNLPNGVAFDARGRLLVTDHISVAIYN